MENKMMAEIEKLMDKAAELYSLNKFYEYNKAVALVHAKFEELVTKFMEERYDDPQPVIREKDFLPIDKAVRWIVTTDDPSDGEEKEGGYLHLELSLYCGRLYTMDMDTGDIQLQFSLHPEDFS